MSKLKEDINRAIISIHRQDNKEWIHLKEIYKKVEEIRNKPNANNGASIRESIENHCTKCKHFKGESLYDLKEKGTGLYKSIYYNNLVEIEKIKIGETFTREQIMNLFKVSGQSGIMKTNSLDALVLISDISNNVYDDSIIKDGKLLYTGEGLRGNQQLNKNNKTLYESLETQLNIYLFTKDEKRVYTYEGQVKLYDHPYEAFENDIDEVKRKVWKFPLQIVYSDGKDSNELSDLKYSKVVEDIKNIQDNVSVISENKELTFINEPLKVRRYRENSEKRKMNRKYKPDYIAEEIIKNKQGIINEKVIFENEIRIMTELKAYKQIEKMKEFFENKKENEGYDILSFQLKDNGEYIEKYIEVKSTKNEEGTPIDITDNEIRFAKDHIDQYYIYRIIKSESKDRYVKIVTGKELFENFEFIPTTFKIYSK